MSAREWQPGDVAMARVTTRGRERRRVERISDDMYPWKVLDEIGGRVAASVVVDACRLVEIDPEDREQVERLDDIYQAALDAASRFHSLADVMQTALREFANPTPPKPDEPTGLGAVIEDASGQLWVRTHHHWRREDLAGIAWDDLSVVRVLSEGVTS